MESIERGHVARTGTVSDREPDRARWRLRDFAPAVIVTVIGLAVHVVLASLPAREARRAVRDEALLQQATGFAIVIAALLVAWRFRLGVTRAKVATALVLVALALREMDMHSRFTEEPVTSVRFYRDGSIDLLLRLGVAAIIAFFVCAAILAAFAWAKPFARALRTCRPWALYALVWMSFIVVAQVIDKLTDSHGFGDRFEEVLELCASVLIWFVVALAPIHAVTSPGAIPPVAPRPAMPPPSPG